ncbi:tetratricopeptide repeat protein [Kribbella sandramycini]|uniref:Putative ATPase/DNA-binding SARP family transcriptional activator n=1 Tax=Kribbella sandramycini TaxID=60450 RepID=A0A7Y4L407_9ACTN|nr:BTAD domain-containing putative transcriptional regulator [Kribbella sandramycini]MBB6570764.1 putative ATPase/DNA-binding SARP family transcriptional activator [Kribbella sandramycini]NOL43904.1 tetratricopeptide repeat protein [Kribbella sandramycini]
MPSAHGLEVLVLGPLAVRLGGLPVAVDRPLERALLVRLALAGGMPVPDHRLAADLWGDVDLARPTERLRVLASRLRAAIDSPDSLTRANGGYALAAELTDLAEARAAAERMHVAVRAGDQVAVRAAAQEALDQWRGPALADLRTIPYAGVEGEQLDAWRLTLQVELLDAELSLGHAAEAARELEALAAENPLHERLWCLLALALYRTGRQADALTRMARLRSRLADELGVDPAPDTAAMELRLLRQDPTLLLTATEPPAVRGAAPSAPVADLPAPLTSFVGRQEELAWLIRRLGTPGVVTLTGGPGSGKSRLSVEAARAVSGRPIRVVELAPLQRESAVLEAIAGDDAGGADPIAGAASTLDGSILVLDNAEHVIEQVAEIVAGLVRRAPGLTVVVSSQRPLQLEAEEVRPMRPMDALAAAQLFAERCAIDAQGADPEQVAAICSAVDRFPLGIELAAGLTRTLTVPQLAQRLTDRMRLLVAGTRDSQARHTSLVAALDWSHQLLGGAERAVLRRVAVFTGGFTLEAAEQVALDPRDVAPALTELADRSLLTVEAVNGRRFRLLETVRDYALGKLDEAGETEAARAAELEWALGFVRTTGQQGDDFASAESVNEVFAEWPNLLDVLDRAAGTDRAVGGLQLALAMHTPWLIRGWYAEAARHFAALTDAPGATTAERLTALCNHGFVLTMRGRFDQAAELLTEAERLAPQQDDDTLTLTALYYRSIVEIERGRLLDAFTPLLSGQALARTSDQHERRLSAFTDALGTLYVYTGQSERALECYEVCIVADREYGDEHGLSRGLSNLAGALVGLDRSADALKAAAESDHYARRLDDRQILPLNDVVRGLVAVAHNNLDEAEKHLRSAVEYALADDSGVSHAYIDLADVLIRQDELAEASALLDAVFAEAPVHSTSWLAARAVAAALALAQGDHQRAKALADETSLAYTRTGFAWPRYATRLAAVQAALSA